MRQAAYSLTAIERESGAYVSGIRFCVDTPEARTRLEQRFLHACERSSRAAGRHVTYRLVSSHPATWTSVYGHFFRMHINGLIDAEDLERRLDYWRARLSPTPRNPSPRVGA